MLDLILIGFIAFMGFISYKRGFVISIYKLFSIFITLGIAFICYPIIGELLKLTSIDENIQSYITSIIANLSIVEGLQSQTQALQSYLDFMPQDLVNILVENNNKEVYELFEVNNIVDYVATYISNMAVNVIAIFITWIIATIGLAIGIRSVNVITKLPVIRTFNELGGLCVGLIHSVIIIWLFCLIAPFIMESASFTWLKTIWNSSSLINIFYENNLILNYITQFSLK